jgi:hypothetical protein
MAFVLATLVSVAEPAAAMTKEQYCRNYTGMAIGSARNNIRWHCGFGGSRYTLNSRAHFGWCMSVERPISAQEHDIRAHEMNVCKH